MDYSRLRATALAGTDNEEAVTVDTRALIDKVLARYSGEWTTLRELIQNAADAQATGVKIRFETLPSSQVPLPPTPSQSDLLKHTITNHTLKRLVVENDGQPFTPTDWGRLKRIAEGNPDETKIGAFGVGFYSVFADCEEPFVSSGAEAMAFYWKGNSLFTKKTRLPPEQTTGLTTFVLDYRNTTSPVPNLLSVCQFLATSLTFVALQRIEFWIDDWRVLALHKKNSSSAPVSVSKHFQTTTPENLFKLSLVERMGVQIDASHMHAVGWKPQASTVARSLESLGGQISDAPLIKSFFARFSSSSTQPKGKAHVEEAKTKGAVEEDITKAATSTIFLGVTSAQFSTNVSATFAAELERATKKPPPRIARLSILTSSYDEAAASENPKDSKATDIFASVLPSKTPGGRVFIGFPTMQTTGAGMHISAPSVIPTVEREAIDLNARWVRSWNIEMLRAAGIIIRLTFTDDMMQLSERMKALAPNRRLTKNEVTQYMPVAQHILKTYSFDHSTPSRNVCEILETAFWTAYQSPALDIYSTRGVMSSAHVRIPSEELAKFVDGIPTIPEELKDSLFVKKLTDFGLIEQISAGDLRNELSSKAMTKDQLTHFIKWAAARSVSGQLNATATRALLDVAIAALENEKGEQQGRIVTLCGIKYFLSANKIPPNLPIPPDTIPFSLTSHCSTAELLALGWKQLEILPWLQYLVNVGPQTPDDQNICKSDQFSAQVLGVVSKGWDQLGQPAKNSIVSLLKSHPVMPTKLGMRKPEESFFPSVKLFDDLPVIQGCVNVKDKFLAALGVRKTLDLDTIFARLLHTNGTSGEKRWSHVELIKYLASVRDDIPSADMAKLKMSAFCPAEAGPGGTESPKGTTRQYRVSELFDPQESHRALRLPVIQWPGTLGARSSEARFLTSLGLRLYPSVPELVDLMAGPDPVLRQQAMTYFLAKHVSNDYGNIDSRTPKAFLPLQGNQSTLVAPSGCFTDPSAAVLGFNILRHDLISHSEKLGVSRSPPITDCVNRLISRPPLDATQARELFGYFAQRISELKDNSIAKLKDAAIVPLKPSSEKAGVKFTSPSACYLGEGSTYAEILNFVDFGRDANAFLFHCGAKSEPTRAELAELACNEPARLLGTLEVERYLNLLRSLAESAHELKKNKALWAKMRTSPFLLGWKTVTSSTKKSVSLDEEEDEALMKHYQLACPSAITVSNDFVSYRIFHDSLLCAPEEEVLEAFYVSLGARYLTDLVQQTRRMGSPINRPDKTSKLHKLVVERSKIFLHEYASDKKAVLKHDAKWLEKNLSVIMVQSISLQRRLAGNAKTHTEKRYAASEDSGRGCVLYITAEEPDMYQVGQAMCHVLLKKHSQQSYIFFEPFLTLGLLGLRSRGYNVERILRAKQAEARVVEEERRKALEEERKRAHDKELEWTSRAKAIAASNDEDQRARDMEAHQDKNQKQPDKLPKMPGAFDDDEDSLPSPPKNKDKGIKGMFSDFTRRFGFDNDGSGSTGGAPAPPVTPNPTPDTSTNQTGRPGGNDNTVTSEAAVHENLLRAVEATRPHGSSRLFSQPTVNEVKEQAVYCDSTPMQDLVFAAESSNGTKVYMDRKAALDHGSFLSRNSAQVNKFARLLVEIGEVFHTPARALHVFFDENGRAMAFNKDGSLFFNLRYYLELHSRNMGQPGGKEEAMVWWWVVMAHELAHNLVHPHNSEHGYYTESFIQQYFTSLMKKVMRSAEQRVSEQAANHALPAPPTAPPTDLMD